MDDPYVIKKWESGLTRRDWIHLFAFLTLLAMLWAEHSSMLDTVRSSERRDDERIWRSIVDHTESLVRASFRIACLERESHGHCSPAPLQEFQP
jgi:hypothetical protein